MFSVKKSLIVLSKRVPTQIDMLKRIQLKNYSVLNSKLSAKKNCLVQPLTVRWINTDDEPITSMVGKPGNVHFRITNVAHPLKAKENLDKSAEFYQKTLGDHSGRQQNHIWTEEELNEKLGTLYHHQPKTIADHVMHKLVRYLMKKLSL